MRFSKLWYDGHLKRLQHFPAHLQVWIWINSKVNCSFKSPRFFFSGPSSIRPASLELHTQGGEYYPFKLIWSRTQKGIPGRTAVQNMSICRSLAFSRLSGKSKTATMGVAHGVTSPKTSRRKKKKEESWHERGFCRVCQPKGTHCHLNINRELGYTSYIYMWSGWRQRTICVINVGKKKLPAKSWNIKADKAQ